MTEAKYTIFNGNVALSVAPVGDNLECCRGDYLLAEVVSWFVVQYGIAAVELQYDQQKRQSQSTQAQL